MGNIESVEMYKNHVKLQTCHNKCYTTDKMLYNTIKCYNIL